MKRKNGLGFLVLLLLVLPQVALAWGTLALTDLHTLIEQSEDLQQEITTTLENLQQTPSEIACVGGRVGGHLGALGGARFAPFRCQFGDRILLIQAENQVILPDGTTFLLEELLDQDPLPEQMSLFYRLTSWQWD